MIDGVSGVSPLASIPRIDYARNVAQTQAAFSIPESALRLEGTSPAQGVAERDPVADSVELSRDFPQLLVNQTYAPPPMEQSVGLPRSGEVDEAEGEESATGDAAEVPVEANEGGEEDVEETAGSEEEKGADGKPLDEAEQQQVRELKARDMEVRAHEQAHKAVGGGYAGGISYEYEQGPDRGRYAVGGEVSIDVSPERDPSATIAKMQQVKAAAMAPAEPSGQDHSVAAQATQYEAEARQQLSEQQRAEQSGETDEAGKTAETGTAGEEEGENGVGGAAGDSSATASASSASASASGGSARLSSSNPFVNRYAESAYVAGNASQLAMSGYTPIDIVA